VLVKGIIFEILMLHIYTYNTLQCSVELPQQHKNITGVTKNCSGCPGYSGYSGAVTVTMGCCCFVYFASRPIVDEFDDG